MAAPSTIAAADWAIGMVEMTEQETSDGQKTGTYVGSVPEGITTPGDYYIEYCLGATPAPGAAIIGVQDVVWGGAAAVTGAEGVVLATGQDEAIATSLLDLTDGIETGFSLRHALRLIAAILAGKVSGAGSGTEVFKGLDGTTVRCTVTVDPVGNRTSIIYAPDTPD